MSSNGRLRDNELVTIVGGGRLRADAGRSWNAFARLCASKGFTVQVTDSYRPLGRPGDYARGVWSQWSAWERYKDHGGNLAATPGQSNHGAGTALDLPPATVEAVRKWGDQFGWNHNHTDAPSESWHHLYKPENVDRAVVNRWSTAQPGDTLQPGAVGMGVVIMKRRLREWGAWPRGWRIDGRYAGRTIRAVRAFQKARHLTPDGIVGPGTWQALNAKPPRVRKPLVRPKPPRAPAAPVARPHADRPVVPVGRSYFADVYEGDTFDARAYANSGQTLIVLKATEGRTFADSTYQARVKAARKASLIVFSYHYARPSANPAEREAENFALAIKTAGLDRDPLHRAILDWEDPHAEGTRNDDWVKAFAARLGELGVTLRVLYSGGWYLNSGTLTKWPVDHTGRALRYWHASYQTDPELTLPKIATGHLWAVQFTDNAPGSPKHVLQGVSAGDVSYLK